MLEKTDWRVRALAATDQSRFGAILHEAMRIHSSLPDSLPKDAERCPRFNGGASITSDGFVMCNFIDRNGDGHSGALVGNVEDLVNNIVGLTKHLRLTLKERSAFLSIMQGWIATDYRSRPGLRIPTIDGGTA